MKKTLFTAVLVMALLTSLLPVSANDDVINFRYGDFFTGTYMHGPSTMEGTTTNSFTIHNSGGFTNSLTEEESVSPTHSLKIDMTSKDSGNFSYEQSFPASERMLKNRIYAEVYFKTDGGNAENLGMFRVVNKTDSSASASAGMTQTVTPAENGWYHAVAVFEPIGSIKSIRIGFSYTKKSAADPIKTFYLDDLSCRIAPYSIFINDATVNDSALNLEKLRVFGFDSENTSKEITATDLVNYEVLSGDAYIDKNGNLISRSGADETVRLKAEFLGATTEFTVYLTPAVLTSPASYDSKTETYFASVYNNSDSPANAKLIVCIYDGDRLSGVSITEKVAGANVETTVTSEKITVPFYVKKPVIKAYCITE